MLISYTIYPYLINKNYHSNSGELKAIVKIFNELQFNVDIIHYSNQRKINYKNYDVIFGFGEAFENSFVQKGLKRIYYATGAHVCYQNYIEIKRVQEVNNKYNSNILPKRLVPWNWSMSTSMSNALIVVGNEWTKSTYEKYTSKQVYPINATALKNENCLTIAKDIENTKKEFLWFGSNGLIHKGLDLCLEFFTMHHDLTLHICGQMEDDFYETFYEYMQYKNIFYHGFIDVASAKFIEITSKCSYSILPTCSEGQSTSLLTTMGAGLIPVSTVFSGIDINKYGILIKDLNNDSIEIAVNQCVNLDLQMIESSSNKCIEYIQENHSVVVFEKTLTKLLLQILE